MVNLLVEAAETIPVLRSLERVRGPGYGEHLEALIHLRRAERATAHALILGHTDTVHPLGTITNRPWRVDGAARIISAPAYLT
ncbi:MAG: hypothetical protein WKF84_28550 [Pyrinomonadaceae bacterium]